MRIVLITGISGSGKSVALNVLEDTGHYCVDNLPPALLSHLVTTLAEEGLQALAVAVDARSAESLATLPADVKRAARGGPRRQGHVPDRQHALAGGAVFGKRGAAIRCRTNCGRGRIPPRAAR